VVSSSGVRVSVGLAGRMYECEGKDESRKCGLLMEWLWHFIMGEEAVQPELSPLIPLLPDVDRLVLSRRPSCLVS
jgi:hypothetical protein